MVLHKQHGGDHAHLLIPSIVFYLRRSDGITTCPTALVPSLVPHSGGNESLDGDFFDSVLVETSRTHELNVAASLLVVSQAGHRRNSDEGQYERLMGHKGKIGDKTEQENLRVESA